MKTLALSLTLILFFVVLASAQTVTEIEATIKTFKHSKRYSVEYDRFADKTFVRYNAATLKSPDTFHRIAFGVSLVSFGNRLKDPAVWFRFGSSSADWQFLRNYDLTIIADGERMVFDHGTRDGRVSSSCRSVSVSETIQHRVEPKQMEKIANAKSVELRLGRFESQLDPEALEMLRNMLTFIKTESNEKKEIEQTPL